jgi:hypothetical protein
MLWRVWFNQSSPCYVARSQVDKTQLAAEDFWVLFLALALLASALVLLRILQVLGSGFGLLCLSEAGV